MTARIMKAGAPAPIKPTVFILPKRLILMRPRGDTSAMGVIAMAVYPERPRPQILSKESGGRGLFDGNKSDPPLALPQRVQVLAKALTLQRHRRL